MEGAGRGLRAEGSGVRERGGVGPPPDAGRREVPSSRRTAGSPCGRWGCCEVRWCGAAVLRSPQPHQHRSSGAVREWVGGLRRGPAPAPRMSGARGTPFRVGYRRRAEPGKGNVGSASPAPHRPGEHSPAAVRPRPGVPGVHRDPCPRLRDAERHPRGAGTAPVPTAPGCGHSPAGGVGPGWGGGAGEAGGGPSAQEFPAAPGEELESGRGLRGTSRTAGNGRGAVGRPGGSGGAAQGSDHIWLCAARGRAGVLRRGTGRGPCPEPGRGGGGGPSPSSPLEWDGAGARVSSRLCAVGGGWGGGCAPRLRAPG